MTRTLLARLLCRVMAVCIAFAPMQLQAGMVGTDAVRPVDRTAIIQQLEAFGVPAQDARERVNALTDAEIASLAAKIETLPAGANGGGVGFVLIILFLIWHFMWGPGAAQPESAKRTAPADKPAAKPAPKEAPK